MHKYPKSSTTDGYIQIYSLAPAPSRDYYGLTVTDEKVVLNTWNVSHGRYVFPKVRRIDFGDFLEDKTWQQEITIVFGVHMCDFIVDLANHNNRLHCIPNNAMLKILSMLSCNDVLRLSQTSKIFWQLCNSNAVWKLIFMKKNRMPVTKEEIRDGATVGWKHVLRKQFIDRKMSSGIRRVKKIPERSVSATETSLKTKTPEKTQKANFRNKFDIHVNPNYCLLTNRSEK